MTKNNHNIEIKVIDNGLIPHPRYSRQQPVAILYHHNNKIVIDFTLLCYETSDALSFDIRNL